MRLVYELLYQQQYFAIDPPNKQDHDAVHTANVWHVRRCK